MELVKTGIPGLDELLKGGVKPDSNILITGTPGSGKTIFGLQFIYEGAKSGDNGLFVSCEETEQSILDYAQSFGFDTKKYQSKIKFMYQSIDGKVVTLGPIIDAIKTNKPKRVVFDSLTLFKYLGLEERAYRKEILSFLQRLREFGVTLIATAERNMEGLDNVEYKPEDFLFDCVILLTRVRKGSTYERCITIVKMKGKDYINGVFPFNITGEGVEVYPDQIPFSLIEKSEKF